MNSINPSVRRRLSGLGDTARLAVQIADLLRPGDAVMLQGPLGAGKSTLARALIRHLTTPDEDVPSPTFTLVQAYETKAGFEIAHFDLYRLADPDEAEELGIDEALQRGAAVIEWPQRLGPRLPADRLAVEFTLPADVTEQAAADEPRDVLLTGQGNWLERMGGLEHDR